jgi:hypothetical protein
MATVLPRCEACKRVHEPGACRASGVTKRVTASTPGESETVTVEVTLPRGVIEAAQRLAAQAGKDVGAWLSALILAARPRMTAAQKQAAYRARMATKGQRNA